MTAPILWGAILLVCGLGLAVAGFAGAGYWIGYIGCMLFVCGAIAVAIGVKRRSSR